MNIQVVTKFWNNYMRYRVGVLSWMVILGLVLASSQGVAKTSSASYEKLNDGLNFSSEQVAAAQLSARFLTRFHYDAKELDDEMSRGIYKQYLKALDGSHLFFTQSDIKEMDAYKEKLDDAIWNGDLTLPFAMFNRYIERSLQRYHYALGMLDSKHDFTGDDTFDLDRKKADWPRNEKAAEDLWRRRTMNDWIRLKLAGQDDDKIKSVLKKRYEGYIKRVEQLDSDDAFQIFMDAYARTTDPHTDYFGPRQAENFNISMRLSLEGIGAVLQADGDYTQIREVVPGGPADKSGKFKAGDRIVAVGQGKKGEMQDILGWRLNDVVDKIRGKKGTSVRLEIIPGKSGLDGEHKTITLVRDKVAIKEQAAKKKILEIEDGERKYRIGIIDLPSFYEDFEAHRSGDQDYRSASRDVAKLLRELKQDKVDGVVMDLRSNGGGSLTEAIRLTGLFIDQGPVVQVRQSNGSIDVNRDDQPGMAWNGPLAVMINRSSASASEIFTAAIKDYNRGIILGNQSFGKGTVQNLINLDNFSDPPHKKPVFGEIKMTIAKFFRINGGSTQLRGVKPHIEFPNNGDDDEFGESTYDNALPWTQVDAADYRPVGDVKPLIELLNQRHKTRTKKSAAWKLMLDELAFSKNNRDRTVVSLNLEKRKQQRDDLEKLEQQFKRRHKSIKDISGKDSIGVKLDDGLQYDERSLETQLEDEKKAKDANDVALNEAAHVLADAIVLLHEKPSLRTAVLPYQGKYKDHLEK